MARRSGHGEGVASVTQPHRPDLHVADAVQRDVDPEPLEVLVHRLESHHSSASGVGRHEDRVEPDVGADVDEGAPLGQVPGIRSTLNGSRSPTWTRCTQSTRSIAKRALGRTVATVVNRFTA